MYKKILSSAQQNRKHLRFIAALVTVLVLLGIAYFTKEKVKPQAAELKQIRKSFYSKGGISDESQERLLVKFKSTTSETQKTKFLSKYKIAERKSLNKTKSEYLKLSSGTDVSSLVETIKSSDKNIIDYIEKDVIVLPVEIPNDPYFSFSSGFSWHSYKIQAPQAWDLTKASGVVVGVCDTGFDGTHPDLKGALLPELGFNTADNSTNWSPIRFHGTGVAGIIGAVANNALGSAGVGWGVRMIPVRVSNLASGGALWSDLAECIVYAADNGAKVINISYIYGDSQTINQAALYAESKGATVVHSAGNTSSQLSSPEYESIIAVGALDQTDRLAWFSSWGSFVDVVAPGVNILTPFDTPTHSYGLFNGTSASAPVVSGVISLLYRAKPNITPAEIRSILASTSDDLGVPGKDIQFGAGRVNALKAVTLALGMPTPIPSSTPTNTPTPTLQQPEPGHPYSPLFSWLTPYGTGDCCGLQVSFSDPFNDKSQLNYYRFNAQGVGGVLFEIPISVLQSSSSGVYTLIMTTKKLAPCTTYNIYAEAVNKSGYTSKPSNILSFTTNTTDNKCQDISPTPSPSVTATPKPSPTPSKIPIPSQTPTLIPPTPTANGYCSQPVTVNIQSATAHSIHQGGVDGNKVFITNNDPSSCPPSFFTTQITYPDGWVVEGIPDGTFPIASGHTVKTLPYIITIPKQYALGSYPYTISVTKIGSQNPLPVTRIITVIPQPVSTADACGLIHTVDLSQLSLQTTTLGSAITNSLTVTHQNLPTCSGSFSTNYSYPAGWNVGNFQTVFQLAGGQSKTIPLIITPSLNTVAGYYAYTFSVGKYMKNYVTVYGKVKVE